MAISKKLPRGIRNHNPANLRRSKDPWQGLADQQTDAEFFQFKAPEWGIRALARTIITYQDKYHLSTIGAVIRRFAPETENDTDGYIETVSQAAKLPAEMRLDMQDYDVLRPIVAAIIRHENGVQPYSDAVIDKGLALAGVVPAVSKPALGPEKAAAVVTAVAGGVPALTLLDDVREALEPILPYWPKVAIVLAVIALAGIGWRVWRVIRA